MTARALAAALPGLIALLTQIWPMPDDLPHASGVANVNTDWNSHEPASYGNNDEKVAQWLEDAERKRGAT